MELEQSREAKDMLLALGGAALVLFGAGLILSHPIVRRYLGNVGANGLIEAAMPDIERYMRMKNM